ncbi:sterol desaturase family protein [Pseudochryseolinea flava]|uniref:Sterol desaturase n=1 Tax=Pseudochryseolinea flava TaxID=2059302 RepID=A0A364XVM4_9BACT|nr:sterol desaturase family protein [Pseudochryseolinea flava]RAV97771.1 sterol desaturase [Pseudochryseolinea flava]
MSEHSWSSTPLNYAAFAIPAFFIFVGLEYFIATKQGRKYLFKFDSSIANFSIGVAERLLNLFLTASFYGVFYYVYENFAIWALPNTWWMWGILILSTDLVWYWYHRLGHEVNLFWGAHIVHHQSEEFNYSVSARITTLQAIVRNVFWALLPLAGFHPSMVIATLIIHGAYSFFTHTQIVGKLGWLEHIFITPSHHRVHHASNEKYLDKNYGDLFVFWDKIFGTFQTEKEEEHGATVYGLTHPIKSHSFIWQHFHYYLEMLYAIRKTHGLRAKFKIIFGNPEVLDQNIRPKLERIYLASRQQVRGTLAYKQYVTAQFIFIILLTFVFSLFFSHLTVIDKFFGVLFTIVTLINCGALLEQRTWMYYLEHFRLLVIFTYISLLFEQPEWLVLSGLFSLFLLSPFSSTKQWYLTLLYGKR